MKNKKLKAKWVAALRSGKYKQGYYALKSLTKEGNIYYCPLGVLEEISDGKVGRHHLPTCYNTYLNTNVVPIDEQVMVARMNDGSKIGFRQIADIIEKEL